MRPVFKRATAILYGILAFALTFVLNELGTDVLYQVIYQRWIRGQSNFGVVVDFQRIGTIFSWGYPIAVGCTTAYLFWFGVPRQSKRTSLYLLLLAIVGPLTFINYQSTHQLINLWIQAAFNALVAFVGYVLVLIIRQRRAQSLDGQALQSISILLIASLLIALPLFYTGMFLADALHLISHEQVARIPDSIPSAIAGLVGIIAALIGNLRETVTQSRTASMRF